MRSRLWRSIQSGLPESAHGSPELVKHASLVEVDGMSRNIVTTKEWPMLNLNSFAPEPYGWACLKRMSG